MTLNIERYRMLKEFLAIHPPQFTISSRCCNYSKKLPSSHFMKEVNGDLKILGVRKAEGGIRQLTANCFTWGKNNSYAVYRPIFWFTNEDKTAYEQIFGVTHSECYTLYGLKRTGCVGCPYNSRVFGELERVRQWEAGLVRQLRQYSLRRMTTHASTKSIGHCTAEKRCRCLERRSIDARSEF